MGRNQDKGGLRSEYAKDMVLLVLLVFGVLGGIVIGRGKKYIKKHFVL